MENPIDHTIDLGLVNYVKHPSNPNYIVFRFVDPKRAESFELELTELNIWFEKGEEEKRGRTYLLFGIHKNDFKVTEKINYRVEAKHKKPFIPVKLIRYPIMIISAIMLTVAILGYCEQQKKLRSHNNLHQSYNNQSDNNSVTE